MIEQKRKAGIPDAPDRTLPAALANLPTIARAIAAFFGDSCEVVVHDLSDRSSLDHTIAVIAGNVTNRRIGGPPTDVLLQKLRSQERIDDFMIYSSPTKDGRALKSCTCFIRNERGRVVGALCINIDISSLLAATSALQRICSVGQGGDGVESPEIFASAVSETLDTMVDNAIRDSGKLVHEMTKEDKVDVVRFLDRRGAFVIRGAASLVASRLGVSRYTVYNYLNEVRGGAM